MGLVQRKFPLRMMHALGATLHDGGICDATGEAGYVAVLGAHPGPDIESVVDADLLLLWGCDMARTHQHLQPRVRELLGRGVPVIALDIWRSDTIRALERWGGRGLVIRARDGRRAGAVPDAHRLRARARRPRLPARKSAWAPRNSRRTCARAATSRARRASPASRSSRSRAWRASCSARVRRSSRPAWASRAGATAA
jgi:hypothetical protein